MLPDLPGRHSRQAQGHRGGTGVVSHVGAVLLRILADRAGLTSALSHGDEPSWPAADPRSERVAVDLAVMIADGGESICDIDVLRYQR